MVVYKNGTRSFWQVNYLLKRRVMKVFLKNDSMFFLVRASGNPGVNVKKVKEAISQKIVQPRPMTQCHLYTTSSVHYFPPFVINGPFIFM